MTKKGTIQQDAQLEKYQASIRMRHVVREWYKTPLGQAVEQQECHALEEILPGLFGYHLLQLSEHGVSRYLEKSTIRHKVIMDTDSVNLESAVDMRCNSHLVPVSSDSVDVVLLPHTLDVDISPHLVLREVERVLVPEGKIVVLGFNPWSIWGLRRMFYWWSDSVPWGMRFISPFRIKDWLTLLGFEIESVQTFFYRPPFGNSVAVNKLGFMDKIGQTLWPAFGGVYVLVASKKVSNMTPIRPRWFLRRRAKVIPGFIETRNDS